MATSDLEEKSDKSKRERLNLSISSLSSIGTPETEENWPVLLVDKNRPTQEKWKDRDPVAVERNNLLSICKLVVKEVIETSLKHGRMLDSDSVPLQHFFIILEHVLRHGLRSRKGLLGPKKDIWDLLQAVEKLCPEAQDITASVKQLPTVSTSLGRSRAWLRLALMQKNLADYFQALVDHKNDLLEEYYESSALMMSDDAVIIMGMLLGLNVVDCNICLKEEDLDIQRGVIDFSLYLRSPLPKDPLPLPSPPANMDTVLDQKNYVEELNRHLTATVGNLQNTVDNLQTTNALMKEDLAVANNKVISLQEEHPEKGEVTSLLEHLHQEKQLRSGLEKELQLQVEIKTEMEMAMKLLEKDVHEKQDTIISLRRQLDDIKLINLEMYKKLQECESSLKHKTDLISRLEAKSTALSDMVENLEAKLTDLETEKSAAEETSRRLGQQIADRELRTSSLEGDLKIEREWRQSLQDTSVKDKETISQQQQQFENLNKVQQEYDKLKVAYKEAEHQLEEYDQTLEEMGVSLCESKLQISALREAQLSHNLWMPDNQVKECKLCAKEFGIKRRRHHCRNCGDIFCNNCSDNTMPLASSSRPVRVCDICHTHLLKRFQASNGT